MTIFSTAAIKEKTGNPFILGDGRVTGYNLLDNNRFLIRTSSVNGALTVDFRKDNKCNSYRFFLTDKGWTLQDSAKVPSKINADPSVALANKDQLIEAIKAAAVLDGIIQIIPSEDLVTKEAFYSAYMELELEPEPGAADAPDEAPRVGL